MSKRAIEIFKSKTTLEERQLFVKYVLDYHSKHLTLNTFLLLIAKDLSDIIWRSYYDISIRGDRYTFKSMLYKRFTKEELNTPFDINELKQK